MLHVQHAVVVTMALTVVYSLVLVCSSAQASQNADAEHQKRHECCGYQEQNLPWLQLARHLSIDDPPIAWLLRA